LPCIQLPILVSNTQKEVRCSELPRLLAVCLWCGVATSGLTMPKHGSSCLWCGVATLGPTVPKHESPPECFCVGRIARIYVIGLRLCWQSACGVASGSSCPTVPMRIFGHSGPKHESPPECFCVGLNLYHGGSNPYFDYLANFKKPSWAWVPRLRYPQTV
jgi:hypothetical protein